MKIGVAGTGRMGTAIVRRLIKRGHQVEVWNRTFKNAIGAIDAGARWNPTPTELASQSEVVISFLFDDWALARPYLGTDGFLANHIEGRLFIDMSTVSPGAHGSIASAIKSRNADFLECPVSGSTLSARSGTLVGFAGGDAAAFARAQPLLLELCRRVELVGPMGAGARMKLAANLLLAVFWQALGESLLLVDTSTMDPARAIDLLADSNIGAAILRSRASQIVAALNGDTSEPVSFDIDTVRKDLAYMTEAVRAMGGTLPLAARTLECFDLASREGSGGLDSAAYPAYWIARLRAEVGNGTPPASMPR